MSTGPVRLDEVWAFCMARLDDEEAAARRVGYDRIEAVGYLWGTKHLLLLRDDGSEPKTTVELDADLADHITQHGPARVLARTAFLRSVVLAEHEPVLVAAGDGRETAPMVVCRVDGDDCSVTQGFAALYNEHPAYKAAWRP
ncbi:DUF6221 family protein [Streptomyces misionensis]|uniref:DUF6221 family protein n=1 Tax=Streptomyces misionensis TaxID=67331 RepID=UPI0033BB427C